MCFPPKLVATPTPTPDPHQGVLFQNTQNSNKSLKILDCPLFLVEDTPGIPLSPSSVENPHFPLNPPPGGGTFFKIPKILIGISKSWIALPLGRRYPWYPLPPASGVKNPHLPPLTPTRVGYFFQNTQNSNRGFKTLDCPSLLVDDTPGIPLTPLAAKAKSCT